MANFDNFQDELSSHGIDIHPSELHGQLVGYLCAVKDSTTETQRAALYRDWLDVDVPPGLLVMLEQSATAALEALGEYSDFEFRLLGPEDSASLTSRVRSLALWCGGFISGFGESGRADLHQNDLAEAGRKNVNEALTDLGRIAAMTDEVPESEENEADLLEIQEFVRVSVLLIHAEIGSAGAH